MTPERWQQIKEMFDSALQVEPAQRSAFLSDACGEDQSLRKEVDSLIASHDREGSFIDSPAYEIAAEMLSGDHEPIVGQTIGHYEILSTLGRGGMGEVYLAKDMKLGRKVALKFLPSDFTKDEDRLRRFEQEARTASALNHPNIITIYEVGEADGHRFLATEFVDGETLRPRISSGPPELNEALSIAEQIASALAAAHAVAIIHRDIKPENIMLRRDGIVKVLDFGLAKLMEEKQTGPEDETRGLVKTNTGVVMGTTAYMSPEQARGLPVDARTDIWSVGVVLYEMIVGRIPFAGSTNSDVIVSILEREPPSLSNSLPEVLPELQRIVSKTLQKDREKRYQAIRDLRIDLKDLAGEIDLAKRERKLSAARQESAITQKRTDATRSPFDSLAVLPFTISDPNPEAEYLSDGITESVINALAQLPQLKVMARSTVFRYKDQDRDPGEIGRDLHVKAVVTGRVITHGDILIVSTELVDVADGSQLWGEQYKRNMTDIFKIQDEISTEISEKLRLRLTGEQQQKLTKRHTDNAQAYQLYLKGRYWWNKRTIDGMKKAVAYFEQAIETDPCYALAYAGLGDSYAMLGIYSSLPPKESFPKSKIAQQKALEIDEDLAEAHASLGFTLLYHDWDLKQAEKELRQAIRLNPGYASAHQWLGFCFGLTYRTEEAIAEMSLAQQLDPFSASINYTAVWPVYWARRYVEAIRLYRAAVELHPDFWATHYWLGLACEQKGEFAVAIAELEKAKALGDSPWRLSGLGHVYALAGRRSDAYDVLKELKVLAKEQYVSAYDVAVVYAGLGDRDETFNWLERALNNRDWLLIWLGVDPLFDNLRLDNRFQNVLRGIGLSDKRDIERPTRISDAAIASSQSQRDATGKTRSATSELLNKRVALIALSLLLLVSATFAVYKIISNRRQKASRLAQTPIVLTTTQITSGSGLDGFPSLSPDGNAVAFSSGRNGKFEIYVIQLTPGSREVQITSDGGQNMGPAWSPDGKLIAYSSSRRGIWVVPALGGIAKQLTQFGSRPSWSPDGQSIAFESASSSTVEANQRAMPPSILWLVPSQGGEARSLTQVGNPVGGHGAPSWSPDGKRIAFTVGDFNSTDLTIWSMSLAGSDLKRLVVGAFDPLYSPDGERIYFAKAYGLWSLAISPDSGEALGEPVQLIPATGHGRIRFLSVSADGKKLAFSPITSTSNLWSLPLSSKSNQATGQPVPLTQNTNFRTNLPFFSPDGHKIAYMSWPTGASNIWLMDADGKNQTQLTTSDAGVPSWLGQDKVAFLPRREERSKLWSVPINGGSEKPLFDFNDKVDFARVSPDGKTVAFNSKKSGTTNVWTIAIAGGEAKQLTFDKEAMSFPSWSPDGRLLALQVKRGDDTNVAIIPSDGGPLTQLTFDHGASFAHSWSPDGDKIAFAGFRDGFWNIWWVSRSTKQTKQLTNYTAYNTFVRYPTWSPLGNQIVYEYAGAAGNIWLMELK